MTSVRGQGQPAQRRQASKAPIGLSSSNRDYKNPLRPNKPELSKSLIDSKASTGSETPAGPKAPSKPSQTLPLPVPQDLDTNCYSQ